MFSFLLAACSGFNVGEQHFSMSYETPEQAEAAAGKSGAPPASAKASDAPVIAYTETTLPNGLTLIVHEDHKAPIVAVNVWYHVGSKNEKPGRTGFAHLFEHLMFNGSEHYDDEYFRPLEAAGATKANGNTWLDRTAFFENVPTSALDLALWMESDRMGHLLAAVDQKKLDEQRGVVQNEKRQDENEPYGKVDELIAQSTYPANHPYSWTTIGSMEDLNAASLADVKDWFRTWYGAANATLVIAGDVKTDEVQKKVAQYFGDIPAGPVLHRQTEWVAKMSGEHRARIQDRVPQSRLYKVWNVPGTATRDYELLDFAASVLAMGKNSRLYKRLVYQERLATGVSVGMGPFELGSQFTVDVTAKPGQPLAPIEAIVDEEMAKLLRDGPTEEEMNRIRTDSDAGFLRALERIDGFGGKSAILAESQVYGGSPDFYRTRRAWDDSATANDVRNAARRWLSDGVFVLQVDPVPETTVTASSIDRGKLPATGTPPSLQLPPLQRDILSNGLKLALAERHAVPVVQFNLMVDAGYAADPAKAPGLAKMTLDMLDEGTTTRDALAINARMEDLGAAMSTASGQDASFISLSAMKSRLADSLELYADVIRNPSFPNQELERLRALRLAAIQQEKAQPFGIALRIYRELIFGPGHAYATPASGNGTEASTRALTPALLRDFYARWLRPDNATLLIVGDTTLQEIKPLLEARLGGWKAPATPLPAKNIAPVPLPESPRVFLVNRTGSEQSLILATHVAPPKADPDDIPMLAANTVLGGLFTSRLNMNLREDKHWSYGSASVLSDARGPRPFIAYASVQTDKTGESLAEMQRELKDLLDKRPVRKEEIAAAQKALVLSLPGDNETTPELAGSYATILNYGLPDDYYNSFVDKVLALDADSAEAAARKLVHPQALTWIVIGDLAQIEPAVRKLGFGEVTVLDADGKVLR